MTSGRPHERKDHKAAFAEEDGVNLTFTPFFVRAVLASLAKSFPMLNASIDGTESIVYHRDVNIGIAVALDGGLIVPVIHNADEKSFLGHRACGSTDLGHARPRQAAEAGGRSQGGTFTVTNPGVSSAASGAPP